MPIRGLIGIIHADALQSFEYSHRIRHDLNDFFYTNDKSDINTHWTSEGFKNPAGSGIIAYSRAAFSYPSLCAYTKWPTLSGTAPNRPVTMVLLEEGSWGRTSIYGFLEITTSFRFRAGVAEQRLDLTVTTHLPADYNTAFHDYHIKLNRANVEGYIDGKLVGIILLGLPEPIPTWDNVQPYALGSIKAGYGTNRTLAMIAHELIAEEIAAGTVFNLVIPTNGNHLVFNDGDPLSPRQYALYTENTTNMWTGLAITGAVTSHPVPIWGYPKKDLYFGAGAQGGSLKVQTYLGGAWRDYESKVLAANEQWAYSITREIAIIRCVYTPTAAETITFAETYLGGE